LGSATGVALRDQHFWPATESGPISAHVLERQLATDFDDFSHRLAADRPPAPFRQRFLDSCARLLAPVL